MLEDYQKVSLLLARGFAFAVDVLIFIAIIYLNSSRLLKVAEDDLIKFVFIVVLLFEFYFLLFESILKFTPGKFLFGLRIKERYENQYQKHLYGSLKFLFEIFKRNLLRVVIFLPPLFIWNEILVLFFSKGNTISELLTSTKVKFSDQ